MHASWRSEPGETLDGTYRLEASLGLGVVGERFEAVDVRDDTSVTVTCLHPALFQGAHRGPNILRIQRARAYAHEHMVGVRDVVLANDSFYVVTDTPKGIPLERWALGRLPLASETLLALLGQIIEALECVHLIGVHGNLKPANILVDEAGQVLVSEPWFLEGVELAETGQLRPRQSHWMAPEQRSGGWQERPETDVFLVGALVGWLVAGRAVVPGVSLTSQHLEVHPRIDALWMRATAARPEDRFQDVGSLWLEVQAAWADLDEGAEDGAEASTDAQAIEPPVLPESAQPVDIDMGEVVTNSTTEAIPLDEFAAMGLDPGVSENAGEVDAIVIVDGVSDEDAVEPEDYEEVVVIPSVTDTSFIPMDAPDDSGEIVEAVIEVGIIERTAADPTLSEQAEARTIQDVPGPGSARALEAARLAEVHRRRSSADTSYTPSPGTRQPAAPPVRVRSRAVYVAPFLALVAGAAMFWVLSQVTDSTSDSAVDVPVRQDTGPAVPVAAAPAPAAEPAATPPKPEVSATSEPATSPVSDTAPSAEADASQPLAALGPDGGPAQPPGPDAASASPPPPDAGPTSSDTAGHSAEGKREDAAEPAPAVVPPAEESFEDMEADAYRCPTGMAKIRSRRWVTLPNGKKKKRKVIWCTDRYEYPGKGSPPTTNVTLAAAKNTCKARGRRLCRRREWRGACGGSKFPYRGDYDSARCNTVAPGGIPRAVVAAGSKPRCKGGFGTYDMSGNVAEWTTDGTVNGGSAYKDGASATCYRSARRSGGSPYVGFRCCADPMPIPQEPQESGP